MVDLILKPGRERSLEHRHPWVFSGAVARFSGVVEPGGIVTVRAHDGRFLAQAYANERSQIVARALSFEDEAIDEAFFTRRIERALGLRESLVDLQATNAQRLVNAEADGLPGLVADRYGDVVVVQVLTAGIERVRDAVVAALKERTGARAVVERSDADVREKEGLSSRVEVLFGDVGGGRVEIDENGRRFLVDVLRGHKTGFYLDQRDNRRRVAELAVGRDVLNAFSYTGGFGVYAARAGARSVLHLDASEDALALARENMELNGVSSEGTTLAGDAFQVLRRFKDEGRRFDLVVLDPPKFAHHKGQVDRACRGYKDINRVALQLLRPGGFLFTFSCSGLVSADLFQKVVFGAATDARVDAQVIGRLGQASDHPFSLAFPEGEYLKGLVCRVVDGPGSSHA